MISFLKKIYFRIWFFSMTWKKRKYYNKKDPFIYK